MHDLECPYCGAENEHDYDLGFNEDKTYKMECCSCEKIFIYTIGTIVTFHSYVAPCLNNVEPHKWEDVCRTPAYRGELPNLTKKIRCSVCCCEEEVPEPNPEEKLIFSFNR